MSTTNQVISSNNGNNQGGQSSIGSAGPQNPHQHANQQMAQMQRNNKKFVEMASKANSNMLAAQQAH